jgi:hypothetical protein
VAARGVGADLEETAARQAEQDAALREMGLPHGLERISLAMSSAQGVERLPSGQGLVTHRNAAVGSDQEARGRRFFENVRDGGRRPGIVARVTLAGCGIEQNRLGTRHEPHDEAGKLARSFRATKGPHLPVGQFGEATHTFPSGAKAKLFRSSAGKVDKQAGKRFFVSAVAFEAHTPYIYHPGTTEHYYDGPMDPAIGKSPDGTILNAIVGGRLTMTPARWGQLKGLYDGEVEHLDGCFGALTDGLKSRELGDNTAVVLLSDHGEGFLEHGGMGHAFGHYAELTNVPLVFFAPGLGHGQKIATVVGHPDVNPTILDLMGVAPDARVQGESLLPMILRQGPWVPRVMPSEYGRSYSLRSHGLHHIVDYSGNESLYDIAADPSEKKELKNERPWAWRYMRDLAGIYLAHRAHWHAATWGTLNNHGPGFVAATGE